VVLGLDGPFDLEHFVVLDEQQLIKNFLSQYFFEVQGRNSRFSIRAFAKKLGVSSSALSEILRGEA